MPPEWKREAKKKKRLLLLSPFPAPCTRVTEETSLIRDRFVANLADTLFVIHAHPGSKTEALCREALAQGKAAYTIESEKNSQLIEMGAEKVLPGSVAPMLASQFK